VRTSPTASTATERHGGRVGEALELVGLAALADRLPSTLSGGQQQRVALARALAPRPQAILLDEPFSNLDTTLRVQVRTEVHRLLTELGITTVFVTHDQEEAFVLGDRVAVMNAGRIEQYAAPAEIYDHPASRWVAEFVGEANLVHATADGDRAESLLGTLALRDRLEGPVEVLLRPEHLLLTAAGTTGSSGTAAGGVGTVELVEYYGHDHVTIVLLDDGARLRSRAPGAPPLTRGQRVAVTSSATAAVAFPRDAG
jgi:iron(III) transport system ATP-binding protein